MNDNKNLEQKNELMGENSFMKKLFKKRLNQKGLTLIELLAVIVILAIIAAIAVPAIGSIINRSEDKAILSDASNILAGAKIAATSKACNPALTAVTPAANDSAMNVGSCDSTNAVMAEYVEGLKSGASYLVSKTDNVWSVTYSGFGTMNEVPDAVDANTLTESELNTELDR